MSESLPPKRSSWLSASLSDNFSKSRSPSSFPSSSTQTPTGSDDEYLRKIDVERDAKADAACIGVKEYARALAAFLSSVQGELCFAVFGPWGRGKTYLVRLMQSLLEKRGYGVVEFSVWRFRRTPELWVYLYEVIAEKARSMQGFGATMIALRMAILRNKLWPLLGINLLIGIFIMLLINYKDLTLTSSLTLAIAGVSITGAVIKSISGSIQFLNAMKNQTLQLADHSQKLGLQGVINKDIALLLRAWVPHTEDKWQIERSLFWAYFWPIVICMFLQLASEFASEWPFAWLLNMSPVNLQPTSSQLWLGILVWLVFSGILTWRIWGAHSRSGKLLLIVDDLDRCEPDEMLRIIESLKLLLDEPSVAERLQLVMLVEESILENAVRRKIIQLRPEDSISNETYSLDKRLVREHIEKLFLCYFRMPLLRDCDVEELVNTFVRNQDYSRSPQPSLSLRIRHFLCGFSFPSTSSDSGSTMASEANKSELVDAFTANDINILKSALTSGFLPDRFANPSPRSIRCWLFKFQLVRVLHNFQTEGESGDSTQRLVDNLMLAFQEKLGESIDETKKNNDYFRLAQTVA